MSRQDFKHVQVASDVVLSAMPFDHSRLAHSTMHDTELQREVVGLFMIQLKETRDRLEGAPLSSEDRKFLSHNLRGAASAIGALQIEELAKCWEKVGFDPKVLSALLQQAEIEFLELTSTYLS